MSTVATQTPLSIGLDHAWGNSAGAAAIRAGLVFGLGYILPRLIAGHAVAGVQWVATLLTAILAARAVFCYLRDKPVAEEAPVVLLGDESVSPDTLDAVLPGALPRSSAKPQKWSLELLHALEWKRMAEVCLAFYRERGLYGKLGVIGVDGSVDVRLYRTEAPPDAVPHALLHCKARGEQVVGADAVLALHARMMELGASRAFFMGAWAFDAAAKEIAQKSQITLVDDRMFLALIGRLPTPDSQRLLAIAVEGDYLTPSCPVCGLKMIPRESGEGRYWGCRAFPRCKHTLGMRV